MRDEVELLLEMYKVQVSRSEHYENLRAQVTNVILSLSAAFVALVALDTKMSPTDVWWGICLIVLGCFGFAASSAHAARSRRHGHRSEVLREAIDEMLPDAGLKDIFKDKSGRDTNLFRIWNALHLAIVAAGVVIVMASFAAGTGTP